MDMFIVQKRNRSLRGGKGIFQMFTSLCLDIGDACSYTLLHLTLGQQ